MGPDEFDAAPEYISIDAPMARALIKKTTGDEITVSQHGTEVTYEILTVSYDHQSR